jgi:uncharacterized protein (UPF0276 family)
MNGNRATTGIGLRAPHLAEISSDRPSIGFLEIHAENYLAPTPALRTVEGLRADYPLSVHAVGLSLGSVDGLDDMHLDRVAALIERVDPMLVSDHLAWSRIDGRFYNDLLPLPYTEEALSVVVRNVQRLQERLRRRVSIENPSCYLHFRHSTMSEPEFLAEVAQRSGCGILLDVNNVVVTAHNLRLDPARWLEDLPVHAVTEYHLAGHAVNDADGETVLIDDHGSRVGDRVFELFGEMVQRYGRRPTLVEWDTDIPALDVLLGEARRAARMLEAGRAHARAA